MDELNLEFLIRESKRLTADKFNLLQKKIPTTDIAKYNHFIYELAIALYNTSDHNGIRPNIIELIRLIDSCFSAHALKQENLGYEVVLLIEAVRTTADDYIYEHYTRHEQELHTTIVPMRPLIAVAQSLILQTPPHQHSTQQLQLGPPYRQRLKSIILNKALENIRERFYNKIKDKITTNEKTRHLIFYPILLEQEIQKKIDAIIKNHLALDAEQIIHETAKKNLKHLNQRFFSNIIAVNAFMKLTAVIFKDQKISNYVITEPVILYAIAVLCYSDLFSNLISKTLWKQKAWFLSFTLISIVGAALGEPWVDREPNLGYKVIKELSVFAAVTLFHAFKIIIPLYNKYFTKNIRWYLDHFEYEIGGPVNPGRIFMSIGYVILLRAIINLFDMSSKLFNTNALNISNYDWRYFGMFAVTALVTQSFQTWYFTQKLRRYSKETEALMGLPDRDFFQLYSYTKGYSLRSRQSENIWATSWVIFALIISGDLLKIYPDQYWLPSILTFFVLLAGPRLGCFFQREVFSRMDTPKSVSKDYLKLLCQQRFYLNLEHSAIIKTTRLLARDRQYPQHLCERTQQVELSAQTGRPEIMYGERNLASSITALSMHYVIMSYIWDRGIGYGLDNTNTVQTGTWYYLIFHAFCIIAIHFIIRLIQFTISNFDTIETIAIEIPGVLTRAARTVKSLGQCSQEKLWDAISSNVFVLPKSKPRQDIDEHAKELNNIGHVEPASIDIPLDYLPAMPPPSGLYRY